MQLRHFYKHASITMVLASSLSLSSLLFSAPPQALSTELIEPVAPEEYWYKIELLVFAYVNHEDANSEHWPDASKPNFSQQKRILAAKKAYELAAARLSADSAGEALQSQQGEVNEITQQAETENEISPDDTLLVENMHHREFLDIEEEDLSDLKDVLMKMRVNGHYRTLYHQIWRQNVIEKKDEDILFIQGGNTYPVANDLLTTLSDKDEKLNFQKGLGFEAPGTDEALSSVSADETPGLEETPQQNQQLEHELEGTIKLYLSRYLHVDTNLWLSKYAEHNAGLCLGEVDEWNAFEQDNQQIDQSGNVFFVKQTVQMKQTRRLKNNEMHYIDHPLFGAIIKFTPIQTPIDEEAELDKLTL